MSAPELVDRILAALTPASLEQVIRTLAREKGGGDAPSAPTVAVASIAERLLAPYPLTSAAERTRAHLLLGPRIIREVARIPGMLCIEND